MSQLLIQPNVMVLRSGDTYKLVVKGFSEPLICRKLNKVIPFGDAILRDDGITLTRHKFFGSEQVRYGWHQTHVWSADGSFLIGAKEDKKAYAQLSYIAMANVHILEQGIRMAFKKPGMRVLSNFLSEK